MGLIAAVKTTRKNSMERRSFSAGRSNLGREPGLFELL
jgi:hypothetical protein